MIPPGNKLLAQQAAHLRRVADQLEATYRSLGLPSEQLAFVISLTGGCRAAAIALDNAVRLYAEAFELVHGTQPPPERPTLRVVGDDPDQAA